MTKHTRQSNIELLRIVAMLMVLILHSTFFANGSPSYQWIASDTIGAGYFSLVEALTLVCVDCYVLISGYFGIKPTLRKFLSLYFLIVFWRLACVIVSGHALSAKVILWQFNLFGGDWFVGAYMALFVFSYILNIYAEKSSKKEYQKGLCIYLTAMIILGWIVPASYSPMFNFSNGYSVFSLIGVYMIGRYLRLHSSISSRKSGKFWLGLYLLCSMTNVGLYIASRMIVGNSFIGNIVTDWFICYNNPFIIIGSVSLFLFFLNLNIAHSKVINWFAASSFAVFLIHMGPGINDLFRHCAWMIKSEFWPWLWLPLIILFAIGIYVGCTLLDQARVLIWRSIEKLYSMFTQKRQS